MFRSCQIIIRELCCSLLKLYYNIQNLISFYKQGVVAAYHVVWECVVERAVGWVCVVCYVVRDCLGICTESEEEGAIAPGMRTWICKHDLPNANHYC